MNSLRRIRSHHYLKWLPFLWLKNSVRICIEQIISISHLPLIVEEQENLIPKNSNNEPMASMAYIWREGFFGGLGGYGKAYFSGVN